jgi:hypothetical protein
MTPVLYRPGYWTDVAVWIDGRLLQMAADGATVRCFLETDLIWEWTGPEPLLFCRGAVQGHVIVTVHQGRDTDQGWCLGAWIHGTGFTRPLGPTFGVQPVGIDANNAYVVRSGTVYDRAGLIAQPFPSGAPGSSQGLSDVQPDGTIWWADLHRTVVRYGTLFHYPNERVDVRGSVLVGQIGPSDDVGVACGGKVTTVIPGPCYEPHVAVSPTTIEELSA